jgi:hypothetical protein
MGGACSTYRGEDTGFWYGDLKVREHLEHTGEEEMIILKWIF